MPAYFRHETDDNTCSVGRKGNDSDELYTAGVATGWAKAQRAPSPRQKCMDLPDNAGIVTCIYVVWARGRNLDLQILGCELHENAFCSRATPGPAR